MSVDVDEFVNHFRHNCRYQVRKQIMHVQDVVSCPIDNLRNLLELK